MLVKKSVLFILFVLFIVSNAFSSSLIRTYQFDEPSIQKFDGYSSFTYNECRNYGKEGYPELPYFSVSILLPQNTELNNIKIIGSEYYSTIENIKIKPASKQFPISSSIPLDYVDKPIKEIYQSKDQYPKKIITNFDTNYLCGYSIASFAICPVNYIPASNQVKLLKEITFEIETKFSSVASDANRFIKNTSEVKKRIEKIVDNPEMLSQYSIPAQTKDMEEDILLITSTALLPAFNDYISFKQETGFVVATETTENIYSTYSGADSQEKIRNCIIHHYTNNGIEYVILGGDSDTDNSSDIIVPHRGMSAVDDPTIPSDMYYAGLDGNWDTDNDGIWGEENEWDLYAEVSIGRICADSAIEVQNFTHKLEMYQNSPVVADITKALMLGEELNNAPQTNGGTYKNEIVTGGTFNGYTTEGISNDFSVSTLYQMNTNWDKYDVFDQFNSSGVNLLNHLGHSSPSFNMNMYNSDITTTNFTNDGVSRGYVVGYSQGCYNGSFDNWHFDGYYQSDDCFAEKITTLETAEVACVANSRYGWYEPGGTNSSSQYYDRLFYDAIFGQDIFTIGDINRHSKEVDVSMIQGDEYIRWTAYETNLFGDPSMDIWTDAPVAINATYPASIAIGSSSITFTTDAAFARIGLMQNGELIGRGHADATGDIIVNLFSAIDDPNDISVSIIAHNKVRHIGTIVVVSDEAYVIYDSYQINDTSGNNNGEADFGETIALDFTLKNVGNYEATNVNATISTVDSYVTISDATEYYGQIAAGSTTLRNNAFSFSVADDIPDQHVINFDLEVTGSSNRETWNSFFSVTVNAPSLTTDGVIIDDSSFNNNGRLDPGESVSLIIPTNNIGSSDSPNAIGYLSCTSSYISIGNSTYDFGSINSGSTENALFNVIVDADTPIGTNVIFDYTVDSGNYDVSDSFDKMIGLIVEDYESGDFSSFPWTFSGNADWIIDSAESNEGMYCGKSGLITDSQTSEMILTGNVTAAGNLSFYRRVSSESGYDFLKFYIDDTEQDSWSGEVTWAEVSYSVSAGEHTFKWVYEKDSSVSNGSDCAWIDFIIFPAIYFPEPADIEINPTSYNKTLSVDSSTSDILSIMNAGEDLLTYTATISSLRMSPLVDKDDLKKNIPRDASHKKNSEVTYSNSSRAYCDASGGCDEYISRIQVGSIDNSSSTCSGYSDYTGISTDMEIGIGYDIILTIGSPYSGDQGGLWIDWNQDEDFEDAGEEITTGWTGTDPYTTTITPPESALPGVTRMRARLTYNTTPTACGDHTYGEVEDYSINVVSDSPEWIFFDTGATISGTVTQGNSDEIPVHFNSTDLPIGSYSAEISVTSNDPDESTINVPVSMTVTSGGIPEINVSTTNINFGDVEVNSTSSEQITISNSGTGLLSVSITTPNGFSVSNVPKRMLSIEKHKNKFSERNTLDFNIAAGSNQDFLITFEPDAVQSYSGNVIVSNNADSDKLIAVTGVGLPEPEPEIVVTPTDIDITIAYNGTETTDLAIQNIGDAILSYSANINYSSSKETRSKEYCSSTYSDSGLGADDWISNVTFNTFNNTTSYEETDSYGDYTSISTVVTAGETYQLCVTLGFEGTFYTQHVRAWIDWDQDETFNSDETFYLGTAPDDGINRVCLDIDVPIDALAGATRMRIIEQYSSDPGEDGACDPHSTSYGETEDYTINVQQSYPTGWLSLNNSQSTTGSVDLASTDLINVGFDSSELDLGTYTANIVVTSNDSDEPTSVVPVTMTISSIGSEPPTCNTPYPENQPEPAWSVSRTVEIGVTFEDEYGIDTSSIQYRYDKNGNGVYDDDGWQNASIPTTLIGANSILNTKNREITNRASSEIVRSNVTYEVDGEALHFEFRAKDIHGFGYTYSGTSSIEGIGDDYLVRIDTTPPATIAGMGLGNETHDSFQVAWNTIEESLFDTYEIYYSTEAGVTEEDILWDKTNDPTLANVSTWTTTITGLQPYTEYFVRIRARDTLGRTGDFTAESSITTIGQYAPIPPENITLETVGNDVQLSWDAVLYDTDGNEIPVGSYKIYNAAYPDFSIESNFLLTTVETTEYLHENVLTNAYKMFYKVVAVPGYSKHDNSKLEIFRK